MSNESPFLKIPYPNEDDDPWFEGYQETINSVDEFIYGLMATAVNILIPADNIAFNSGTGILSWTGQFQIPIIGSGYFLNIPYGPDQATPQITLNENDRVVVIVPRNSSKNISGYFTKIAGGKIIGQKGLFTLGMRLNNKFYANIPQTIG